MMFAGFFITAKNIPIYLSWITYTSFLYYGMESLAVVIFKRVEDVPHFCGENGTIHYGKLLDQWGYYEKNLDRDISILFFLMCVYHSIALISLNVRNRRK